MINDIKCIDLQYFGDIKLFSTLINETNVFFLPDIRYQKLNHLNRTRLIGANGPLLLTVPLIGGRDKKQTLKDVRISYGDPWQRIHWRGIVSSYRKSPWFEEYAPGLEKLFQLNETFLLDLNLKTMEWVCTKLKMKLAILSGLKSNDALLTSSDSVNSSPTYPVYQQVFSERYGFVSGLGILDLLMCEGPSASAYLERVCQS